MRARNRGALAGVISILVAAVAAAALASPALGAAARPPAAAGAVGYRESHLWTFGPGTVFGWRDIPEPIHGLPAGQHVVGQAFGFGDDFLLANGTVWALNIEPKPTSPRQVSGLAGITAISSAGNTLYAISGTGDVYSWTGTGSATRVAGVSGVTSVVNGYALEAGGTVWQLGGAVPVQVNIPATVTQLSSNPCGGSSYALTSTGSIYAWGANAYGQLGDGTKTASATPVLVHRVRDASQVIGGCFDAYAIVKGTGAVFAWGKGTQGELGNGHRYISTVPVSVSGLSGVTSLAAGYQTSYAVLTDGTVWAWGFGLNGQLGYQPPGCTQPHQNPACYSAVPVQVPGLGTPIATVVASEAQGTELNNALALGRNGTIWGPWPGYGTSNEVTRTPPFRPATALWENQQGFSYGGVIYFAN